MLDDFQGILHKISSLHWTNMSEQATPSSMSTKKRSLSSPEFNLDLKKNRVHISSLSESESDVSLVEDRNMASNIDTDTNTVTADTDVMADHWTPLTQLTLQDAHLKKIATFIEEAFQPKLNTLVQDSIQSQLAGLVTSIVNGVLEGLNAKITSLETENRAQEENFKAGDCSRQC